MKQVSLLLIACWHLSINTYAQNMVHFTLHYKPNSTYHQQLKQSLKYEMNYSGDQKFMDQLKKNHIENPTRTSNESVIETDLKSGSLYQDSLFNLTIQFKRAPQRNNKSIVPDGTMIYGHARTDGSLFVDSLDANITDPNYRTLMSQVVQGIFSQLYIPKRELHVGDTFSVVSPVSIPIGNLKFDLKLTSIYKLKSYVGKIALLEIKQTYTIKSKVEGYAVTANGDGDGIMEYIPENSFFTGYRVNTNLHMKIKSSQMTIDLNSQSVMDQQCKMEISK